MNKMTVYLTYAGTIPFIACTFCLLMGVERLPWLGAVDQILTQYTLVIAAFLSGTYWGLHLHIQQESLPYYLPIISNGLALILWFSSLILSNQSFFIASAVLFIILVLIEYHLFHKQKISYKYLILRWCVTLVVVTTLTVAGIVS